MIGTQKQRSPAVEGEASGNQLGSVLRDSFSPISLQSQFLIAAHHVRPELAAMVAALAFGGGAYHG